MANNSNGRQNGEVEFTIIERIGVIETQPNGWNKELNIVSWNGGQPKFDIREWDPAHERMTRGLTLFEKEASNLAVLLCKKFGLADCPAQDTDEEFADEAFSA